MAFDLSTITTEAVMRPPRMILLGVEKIGKSSFAAASDRPFFMPVKGEEGVDDLTVAKAPVSNSFDEVMGWLGSLYHQPHDYGTAVIDSTSALEPLIWFKTCQQNGGVDSIEKVGGGYAKGYTEALSNWRMLTDTLDWLRRDRNMASILIGHVKVKRFDDPQGESYDQYQWDIDARAANLLFRWSDIILFANTKVIVKKEDIGFKKEKKRGVDLSGSRFLFTQKRPAHPGGGRGVFGRIPYELPLSWDAFVQAVAAAKGN